MNISGALRDMNGDAPSWDKSYQSQSQGNSQVSNRSQVDELFDQMNKRRNNRRGRAFISRNSSIMNQGTM